MFAIEFLSFSIRMKQGNFGFSDGRVTDNQREFYNSENISSFQSRSNFFILSKEKKK